MFHVYVPAVAGITLILVLGVIVIMIRWGPRICRTRHTALPERHDWQHRTYEQPLSTYP